MNKKNLVEYLQKLRKINRNFEYYLYSNIRGRIEQNNKTGLLKYLEKERKSESFFVNLYDCSSINYKVHRKRMLIVEEIIDLVISCDF